MASKKTDKDSTGNGGKIDWAKRDLDAINSGKSQSYTNKQRDSVAATHDRKSWLSTVHASGMDTVASKKKSR